MSVTSSVSGPNVTMNWSVASTIVVSGLTFNFDHVSWSLGPGSSSFASGAGSTTQTVGYSTSYTGTVTAWYKRTGHSDVPVSESTSGTTGAQPVTGQTCSISGYASGTDHVLSMSGSCSGGTITGFDWTMDGGSVRSAFGSYGASTSDSFSYVVGYSTTHTWQCRVDFSDGSHAYSSTLTLTTGSAPTPPSPPAAPPDVTNLVGVIGGGNQAVLTWSGSASGYNVYRNGTYLTSVSSAGYTDSATPTSRPLTYYVVPYNTGPGGTTNGNPSNTVTFNAPNDSVGILAG